MKARQDVAAHASAGGQARAAALPPERRKEIARLAAAARWAKTGGRAPKPPRPHRPRRDDMEDALRRILAWTEAYPVGSFPEPDLAALRDQIGDAAFSALHASWARHLLAGVARYARAGLGQGGRS